MHSMTPARVPRPNAIDMDWGEACREIAAGRRLTRAEWGDPTVTIFLHGVYLHLRKADGVLHVLQVQEGDLLATDWSLGDQAAPFTMPQRAH